MPDSPSQDDPLANLFSRLPDARPRDVEDSAAQAPLSRRAARERQGAPTPTADDREPVAVAASARAATGTPPSASAAPRTDTGAHGALGALLANEIDTDEIDSRADADARKSRIAKWAVLGFVLAIVAAIGIGLFVVWNTYEEQIRDVFGWTEPAEYAEGEATGEATVTIAPGDDGSAISAALFEAGVTRTESTFYDYLIASAQNPPFQPGVYALQQRMTSEAALTALLDPASKQENLAQLREGLTVEASLPILAEATGIPLEEFEAAVEDPSVYDVSADTLEGWLFPATYPFDPGLTAQDIIGQMVDRTVVSLDDAGVPTERRQEILTIASIIQREARYSEDFYRVSTVIQNRLDPNNPETAGLLQMDSTVHYGAGSTEGGTVSTTDEERADDNPWNTYLYPGLPAGPIANPGDLAIDAAMNPEDGPWLYFVTVNLDTGETVFTNTYAEHEAAVAQWQEWCSANPDSGC